MKIGDKIVVLAPNTRTWDIAVVDAVYPGKSMRVSWERNRDDYFIVELASEGDSWWQRCKAWSYPGHESWDCHLPTALNGRQCVRAANHDGPHELAGPRVVATPVTIGNEVEYYAGYGWVRGTIFGFRAGIDIDVRGPGNDTHVNLAFTDEGNSWRHVAKPESLEEKLARVAAIPSDPVNHPPHYAGSEIEVWDAIEAWGLTWPLGNAVKYIARAGKKDPAKLVEDLEKARRCIDRELTLIARRGARPPVPAGKDRVGSPKHHCTANRDDKCTECGVDMGPRL